MSLVPHESAVGHVTGTALYTNDLWPGGSAAYRKAMAANFVAKL